MALIEIDGAVSLPRDLSFEDLRASASQVVERSMLLGGRAIAGVRLGALVETLGIKSWARFLVARGADGHAANIPIAAVPDCVLVYAIGAAPLPRELGGPVRLLTRGLDACTNVKAVVRLTWSEHAVEVERRCRHAERRAPALPVALSGGRS